MTDTKTAFTSLNNPVISVKIKDSGFSYNSFGGAHAAVSEYSEEGPSYADALYRASLIVDGAVGNPDCDVKAFVRELIKLYEQLKECFPVLARQISGWICDICFICDFQKLIPGLCKDGVCDIPFGKEYLIYDWIYNILKEPFENWSDEKLVLALPFICRYDFTLSECYQKNKELYKKVFLCALLPFVKNLISEWGEDSISPKVKKAYRTSFCGLTCSDKSVKLMEIEYLSFSECDTFFDALTSAVRYCDNLIRQSLSVSSKLTGIGLSKEQRKLVYESVRNGIPNLLAPQARAGRKPKKKPEPVNVKNYEKEKSPKPINLEVDFAKAKELLDKSWDLSALFDTDDEDGQIIYSEDEVVFEKEKIEIIEEREPLQLSGWEQFIISLSDKQREILSCILFDGDVTSISRSLGGMPLGFADAINEKALDNLGDIIIDTSDIAALSVFEDYREELSEIMNKNVGGKI